MISRRSLFALFGGAAVAPVVKALPAAASTSPIQYNHTLDAYRWVNVSDNISRHNALLDLMKRKMLITEQRMADDISRALYGDDGNVDDDTIARSQSLDDDYEDDE